MAGQPENKLMKQYRELKARHPDMMLLFRVGDFYELFEQDALDAAAVLGLTITRRGDLPMAGFPYHSLEAYLRKLLGRGRRVAICDPVEAAKPVKTVDVENLLP